MELLQLKYFQSVAKHQNITKAAKELHISQPSLSITIKRLEDELSVPLFNRKGKNIELNNYGKVYLKHVSTILKDLENAKSEVLELAGVRNSHISLSATTTHFVSGILRDFILKNENITMTQTINYEKTIIENLKNRAIDFALTSPMICENNIESIELLEEEIVVVVPNTHRLFKTKSIYLKELQNENFISLTENYSFKQASNNLFDQAGFTPNVIFEGDISIISELMLLKNAICLAPLSVCLSHNNPEYSLIHLKDKNNKRKIGLSYPKGIHLSELSKKFIDFTVKYYKNEWFKVSK